MFMLRESLQPSRVLQTFFVNLSILWTILICLDPVPKNSSQLGFLPRLKGDSGTGTPGSGHSSRSSPKRTQLVSYHDVDAGLTDEEHEPGTLPTPPPFPFIQLGGYSSSSSFPIHLAWCHFRDLSSCTIDDNIEMLLTIIVE
jgi:hypothetical protein